MAITRSFRKLVEERVAEDRIFAEGLLREGIDLMLAGDVDTGISLVRDYIAGTIGFQKLGQALGAQPKTLIRMFSATGNPQARNLFRVLSYLQKQSGVEFHVSASAA